MSSVRVSMMLSLAVVSSSVVLAVEKETPCSAFVEMPKQCSETPGCKVEDEWNCVPDVDPPAPPQGLVWLQFPAPAAGSPGVPVPVFPDEKVPGVPVEGAEMVHITHTVGQVEFPAFLRKTKFHAVPEIQRGGGLRFDCPANHDHVPCDFFVTVFSCGHCSDKVDGGLPQLLTVTHGWEPRSCAPTMVVTDKDEKDEEFKTKIFRVRVMAGKSVETPRLPRAAHFVGVFSSVEPTEYCPANVKVAGPFPPGKTCGSKCPFNFEV